MTDLAVDLGGTRLKAGRLEDGELAEAELLTLEHGGSWRPALEKAKEHFGPVDGVGLCVPGIVDDNRVLALPGKLRGIEGADLAAAFGLPTLVFNDALAYGVGEAARGAGRGHQRVVTVTIGTGVGVAVVEDGAPLGRGPLGGGLLGGQIPLPGRAGGPLDSSGRAGTFEARCQASSLLTEIPIASDLVEAYRLLDNGDAAAVAGFERYRSWLVTGLTALALAYAPSVIVVGGGAAQPQLLEGVEEALASNLWRGQSVEVRPAQLGDSAALAGLGVLLQRRPAS